MPNRTRSVTRVLLGLVLLAGLLASPVHARPTNNLEFYEPVTCAGSNVTKTIGFEAGSVLLVNDGNATAYFSTKGAAATNSSPPLAAGEAISPYVNERSFTRVDVKCSNGTVRVYAWPH